MVQALVASALPDRPCSGLVHTDVIGLPFAADSPHPGPHSRGSKESSLTRRHAHRRLTSDWPLSHGALGLTLAALAGSVA